MFDMKIHCFSKSDTCEIKCTIIKAQQVSQEKNKNILCLNQQPVQSRLWITDEYIMQYQHVTDLLGKLEAFF